MTFAPRLALVLLAAFFLTSIVTSLIAYAYSRRVLQASDVSPQDASALALYRLLPALGAIALTLCVLAPGYVRFEQRDELEGVSVTLALLAAGGFALILGSAIRVVRAIRRASVLGRAWMAQGERIELAGADMPAYALDLPFPLVAVLGVIRPRLFVSRTVLGTCSAPEMAAILEHERAHVLRHDNGMRLLMDATPDLLALTRVPSAVSDRWHRAVEQRADDAAGRKVDLASALVKVARAAANAARLEMPASALYGGEQAAVIGTRVRRLIDARKRDASALHLSAVTTAALTFAAVIGVCAATGLAAGSAHALLEFLVSSLP